eukprot:5898810-Alexandrium_andersonii.AAC.1
MPPQRIPDRARARAAHLHRRWLGATKASAWFGSCCRWQAITYSTCSRGAPSSVSYTHLRAHETSAHL